MIRFGSVYILLSNRIVKQVKLIFAIVFHLKGFFIAMRWIESTTMIDSTFGHSHTNISHEYSCLIRLTARCDGLGVFPLIWPICLRFIRVKFPTIRRGTSGFDCNMASEKENQNNRPDLEGGEENRMGDTGGSRRARPNGGDGSRNGRAIVMRW